MEPNLPRRNLLKVGSTTMGGAVIGLQAASARAQNAEKVAAENAVAVQPLANPSALRFATCQFDAGGPARIGIVLGNGHVIDVQTQARRHKLKLAFPADSMLGFIASGESGMAQIRSLVAMAGQSRVMTVPINQVKLHSPIPRPHSNIYCVGWNYLAHFEEGREARADKTVTTYPDHPVFFTKGVHTMNGPFGTIPYDPGYTAMADWEAELAVVIGKRGRNITEDQAMNHVFGYCAFNDTTVRDVQQKLHGGQWFKGKSLDGYGPMGPWIAMADGVVLDDVRIICRVNGVEKQNASYKQMFFKVPKIIAELSRDLTLEPGDIIATGTPPGVGFSRKPPEFLKPGDLMETEITGVGILRNTIKTEV
jgi:2-keto-4-pentenoate hydratase/2-oxohepta-3-ene-1,7-dioic acid hydratase in catechol pathway